MHLLKFEIKQKRCHYCSKQKLHNLTFYTCTICRDQYNVSIGLCKERCFSMWHKHLSNKNLKTVDKSPIPKMRSTNSTLKPPCKNTNEPQSSEQDPLSPIAITDLRKQQPSSSVIPNSEESRIGDHILMRVNRPRSRGFCVECIRKSKNPEYRKTMVQIRTYCAGCSDTNWTCEPCFRDIHENMEN